MARKITSMVGLDDEFSVMGQRTCPMCGSVRTSDDESDRSEHTDAEIIHKLAEFMADDWKACCVLLLCVAHPNSPVRDIEQLLYPRPEDRIPAKDARPRLGIGSICEARQRAARRFPALAGILGLKTQRAIGQQEFFKAKRKSTRQGDFFQ